jgi:glyoxylase-like metal-dependent hydrolase (beta-lactamase superfamily II)
MRSRKILVILFCSIAAIIAMLSAQEILDAVKAGDLAKVKVLVEKDPKIVNEKAQNGMTVLFAVAKYVGKPLLVDTGFSKHAADALRETIGGLTKGKIKCVINTHPHGDHVDGNGILPPDGKVLNYQNLGHPDFQGLISKGGQALRGRSGREERRSHGPR